ncbi:MAG: N-acetyltransferase [Gammaproteobacteria bacterium]|nr:MAG: N-acetyltransferase [Gammaproteobacteria bacterium]TDJ39253.1 MAG: N-acetyltransferase [Gammaproteobacteria bacterium]
MEPVRTPKDRKRFIRVPWHVYERDSNWVPPLRIDRQQHLSPKAPHFQHLDWQGWIATRDKQPVGRISAQIDRLCSEVGRPELGYFGMLEAIDDADVFGALFDVAEGWLKEQGKTTIAGPFNLNINQDIGLLIDGFDTPPYFLMPHGQPYYDGHVGRLGYEKAVDLLAYEIDPDFELPRVMRAIQNRLKERISIRYLDRKHIDRDLEIMRDIFNDAWSKNWGFVPFTEEEFRAIGREMLLVVKDDFITIADYDGRPCAFLVVLPNLNEAIHDLNGRLTPFGWLKLLWRLKVRYPRSGRVPLMGVRREYHNTRLGPGLAIAVIEVGRAASVKAGIKSLEMSWILETNQGMRNIIDAIGGVENKRYRMYEKQLI